MLPLKKFVFIVLCLVSGFLCLNAQKAQVYKPNISRILFVLDGSGSMKQKWGKSTKFETAKDLLFKLIDSVEQKNPNVEFAVRVFGFQFPNEQKNCKDSKLVIPFAKNNAGKINSVLGGIHPQGMSPIAYSIQMGAKDFPDDAKALNSIVLITDGEENCEGNPCKASKELASKKISLKPFIVGLNVDSSRYEKFNCIGTFFDTKDDASFYNTVGVIIRQTLNTTTAQVNLLDQNGNPTITNIPFTLYDHFSGKIEYNFVHTMNEKGNPDTLFLDPVGVYDLELHTFPSIRKENIELTPGKHNIIALDVPAGDLTADCPIASEAQAVVRQEKELKTILNVQDVNMPVKYIGGTYRLEILTTPEMVLDSTLAAFGDNKIKVPGYGTLSLMTGENQLVSIYKESKKMLQMVARFEMNTKTGNWKLQPGEYTIVYKSKKNYDSESTKTQKFIVEEGRIVTLTL